MISEVILEPVVTITEEKDREKTEKVLQKSEYLNISTFNHRYQS